MRSFLYPLRYRLLVVWLLALTSLISPIGVLSNDRVTTFCFNDWPPYTRTTDSEADGISINIIKRAAQILGREAVFFEMEWNECLNKVKEGAVDAVLDAAQRDEFLQGPTSFNMYTDTFWVNNSSNINRYEQLNGGKIGLVEGYVYNDRLLAHLKTLNLELVYGVDEPTIIRDLAQGQLDTVVADLASTFVFVRQQKIKAHPILPPFSVDKLYLSFNAAKPELQRDFDRIFAELLAQGYVDEVYQQWIGTTYSNFAGAN